MKDTSNSKISMEYNSNLLDNTYLSLNIGLWTLSTLKVKKKYEA